MLYMLERVVAYLGFPGLGERARRGLLSLLLPRARFLLLLRWCVQHVLDTHASVFGTRSTNGSVFNKC